MLNDKIRCAVIGVGNMGKNHVRTYMQLQQVELVAVSDKNTELGQKCAQETGVLFYEDYCELIDKAKPDIISICVPTSHHFDVAKKCIENKINVLLEKPIASNITQSLEILDLAEKNNIKLLVGHIERFNPAVIKLKEMIDGNQLGNITAIIARRVGGFPPQIKDANIAIDLAIHDIDIVNFLLDELPSEISVNKQKNHIEQREDSVEFFLKYNKTSAYIQANWITPVKIRKLTITGSEGYLEMDYITQQIEFYKSNYEKFKESYNNFSDYILRFSEPDKFVITVAKKEPLAEEILYLIKCVKNDIKIKNQFAVDALKIVLA
ncbi:MAG: Gfo/Idh/MocA family oxidoreductase [bacterium]